MTEPRALSARSQALRVAGRLVRHSLAAGVGLLLLLATVPAGAAVTSQTILNAPAAYSSKDSSEELISTTVAMLDAMPRDATFRYAGYLFDTAPVVDAIIRAHRRGVHIRIVLDVAAGTGGQPARLKAELGSDRSHASYLYRPQGSGLSHDPKANLHAKILQFSQTGRRTQVTGIGSGNLSESNTLRSWNEWQFYDNATIYASLRTYFDDIAADRPNPAYFRSVSAGAVTLYLYPGGPDLTYRALGKLACKRGVTVDVAMFQWSDAGSQVKKAQRLQACAAKGAKVRVSVNYMSNRPLIGTKSAEALLKPVAGKPVLQIRNVRKIDVGYTHMKTMIVKDAKGATQVWGGSANWIDNRAFNTDVVSLNTGPGTYRAYAKQYAAMWATGVAMTKAPVYNVHAAGFDQHTEWDDA